MRLFNVVAPVALFLCTLTSAAFYHKGVDLSNDAGKPEIPGKIVWTGHGRNEAKTVCKLDLSTPLSLPDICF